MNEFMVKLYASPNRNAVLYKQMLTYVLANDRVSLTAYLIATPLREPDMLALKESLLMNTEYDEFVEEVIHGKEIHAFFSYYLESIRNKTFFLDKKK